MLERRVLEAGPQQLLPASQRMICTEDPAHPSPRSYPAEKAGPPERSNARAAPTARAAVRRKPAPWLAVQAERPPLAAARPVTIARPRATIS
jgi:hypothetical protein